MSGASVEYFATTDVLALIFDGSAESTLGGNQQPSPMSGDLSPSAYARRIDTSRRVVPRTKRQNVRLSAASL
jgi:Txe/YoeB family toxin of Txe-Axe toxin-antitoxin module